MGLKDLMSKGDDSFEKGNYNEALRYYEKAIKIEPECARIWCKKGQVLNAIKENEAALEAYERAIEIEIGYAEAWYGMGNALSSLERYEKALEAYEKAIERKKEYAEAWYGMGNALSSLERYEKALEAYEKAIERKKEYAEAWYGMGNALSSLERHEEALYIYEEALKILEIDKKTGTPLYAEIYHKKGDVLSLLERYEEALQAYEKALEILKTDISMCAEIYHKKGDVLSLLGRYKEALQVYLGIPEISLESDKKYGFLFKLKGYGDDTERKKNSPESLYEKGDVLHSIEKFEDALKAYRDAIESYENNENEKNKNEKAYIRALNGTGYVYNDLKRYEEALQAFEKALLKAKKSKDSRENEMKLEYAKSLNNKALTHVHLREYTRALKTYNQTIEVYENTNDKKTDEMKLECAKAWNNKGVCLRIFGNYRGALRANKSSIDLFEQLDDLMKSQERKSMYALAWNNRGVILQNLKEYGRAFDAYEEAAKIIPGYAVIYANLAELYLDHGDLKNASEKIDKALQMDKENKTALSIKGKIEVEKRNYDSAISFFRKASRSDSNDPTSLLWTAYTEYLEAESLLTENKATKPEKAENEYKKLIFSAIREMEKTRGLCEKQQRREIRECILYFLGCFYYKSNDVYTAKERLEECIRLESRRVKVWEALNSGSLESELCRFFCFTHREEIVQKIKRFVTAKSTTEQRARELLNHIWKYKLKPAWWRWWWSSPVHKWSKRFIFVLLLFPILSFLFYVLIPESIYITRENLFVYIMLSASIPSIKENLDVYIAMISISVFFLLLPTIEKIKVKEIEVEMSSPPSFEPFVSPSMIEEKIKEI